MDQEVKKLRQWFWQFMEGRPDLTVADVAAYVPISHSSADAFLCKRDDGEPCMRMGSRAWDEFRKLKRLIEQGEVLQPGDKAIAMQLPAAVRAQRARMKKKPRAYYETPNSQKIAKVLDHCAEQAAIGVITADYGVGKTSAVRYWRTRATATASCYFEFDEFSRRTASDFVARLAAVIGSPAGKRAVDTMHAIIRYLCDEPMLLIFDQCEVVTPPVLQIIRQIWDGAHELGTGVVLLSSPLLLVRLQQPKLRMEVGSLSSRVGIWVALDGVDRTHTAEIVRQEGVKAISDAAIDLLIRMTGGSMRRLMAVTDLLITKHADKPVTEHTIEQVAENLWGMQLDPRRRAAA